MTDGDRAEENALIQDHGHRLFGRYMEILMEGGPEVFLLTAKNFAPAGKAHGMFSVHVQKKHVFCFQCSPFYLQFHCSVDTHYHVVLNWESCRNR